MMSLSSPGSLFLNFPSSSRIDGAERSWVSTRRVLDVLKLTDYMMRAYVPTAKAGDEPATEAVPVWLYVGYYQSQRTGATYHSPKNCLPGAGWQFVESEEVTIPLREGSSMRINKFLFKRAWTSKLSSTGIRTGGVSLRVSIGLKGTWSGMRSPSIALMAH